MASTPWRASIAAPSTLRVCRCALMAALACALAALESLIPVPMPVPGMTLAFVRFSSPNRVRLAAMAAAVAHNIGQIAVAVAVTGTPEIAFYLPVLLVAGIAAGFATGTVAQAVLDRIPHAHATADRGKRVRA